MQGIYAINNLTKINDNGKGGKDIIKDRSLNDNIWKFGKQQNKENDCICIQIIRSLQLYPKNMYLVNNTLQTIINLSANEENRKTFTDIIPPLTGGSSINVPVIIIQAGFSYINEIEIVKLLCMLILSTVQGNGHYSKRLGMYIYIKCIDI